jgi:transposase-like protein
MKYRKWDPKTKAKIVLEGLDKTIPLADLCKKYQISQSQYYRWAEEFQANAAKAFESTKNHKKEQKMHSEIKKLKNIIAELSIELKKTELELAEGDEL